MLALNQTSKIIHPIKTKKQKNDHNNNITCYERKKLISTFITTLTFVS